MPTVKNVGHAPKSNTTRGNVRPMHDKNLSSVAHEVPSTNHNHQILFFKKKKKKNREIHKKSNHANPNERRVAFLGR